MNKYLILLNKCKKCGVVFETLSDPGDYSTRLLLSEKTYQAAIVLCDKDPAFKEVYKIVKKYLVKKVSTAIEAAEMFDDVFGRICDKAPDGSNYNMTGKRKCPKCQSIDIEYGPTDPPVYRAEQLREVTHMGWDRLSIYEKEVIVKGTIEKIEKGKDIGVKS